MICLIETGGQTNRWDWEDPALNGPYRAAMGKAECHGSIEDRRNLARLDELFGRAERFVSALPAEKRCVYLPGLDLLGYTKEARAAMRFQTEYLAKHLKAAGIAPMVYLDCEAPSKTLSGKTPQNEYAYRARVLAEVMEPLEAIGCKWWNYQFGRTSAKIPTIAWWGGPCVNVKCGDFNSTDMYVQSSGGGATGYLQRLKNMASSIATNTPTIPHLPPLSEHKGRDLQTADAALRQVAGIIHAAAARCDYIALALYMWPESEHADLLGVIDSALNDVRGD